jgi:hypothetical protein
VALEFGWIAPEGSAYMHSAALEEGQFNYCNEVITGVFESETGVVSRKELCRRYGICYRTLRQALAECEKQGLVSVWKQGYRAVRYAVSPKHNRIVLVARGTNNQKGISILTHRTRVLLLTLEQQCHLRGLELEIQSMFFSEKGIQFPEPVRRMLENDRERAPLGILFWTMSIPDTVVKDGIGLLCRGSIPFAVLDDTENVNPAAAVVFPEHGLLCKGVSSEMSGIILGRFLAGLVTGTLCIISPYHDAPFSIHRYEGLCKAFKEAGPPATGPSVTRLSAAGPLAVLPCVAGDTTHLLKSSQVSRPLEYLLRERLRELAITGIDC